MHFSFQHPDADMIGFEVVDDLADADFAIVDADSKPAVREVVRAARVADSVFVGSAAPPGAAALVPRPIDTARILRALVDMVAFHAAPPHDEPLWQGFDDPDEIIIVEPPLLLDEVTLSLDTVPAAFQMLEPMSELEIEIEIEPELESEPELEPEPELAPEPEPVPAPEPSPPLAAPAAPEVSAREAAKAAARTAARRARQTHSNTDPGALEQLRDVLVFDADPDASQHLRGLLELFGFRVHVAGDVTQAADVLSRRALVAAFLDIALTGANHGDGLALIQTIHELPRSVGHPTPAVLIVTAELKPAARVRAALAGIDSPLIKPVTRGDVARALEACDVLLPADARRDPRRP
jgi:CheY-like chemotaxis protein